jgi:hypothetical protein
MRVQEHMTLIYRLIDNCIIAVILMIRAIPDDRYLLARYRSSRLLLHHRLISHHLYISDIQLLRHRFDHFLTSYYYTLALFLRCAAL